MECPECGSGIEDGKAYCSNPACGAVLPPARPDGEVSSGKYVPVKLNLDFALLARLAAALIVLIAAAILYYTRR